MGAMTVSLYTYVLVDAVGNEMLASTATFATEISAMRSAAIQLFWMDQAAAYEVWKDGRSVMRFAKP
jgi:hypothetical protein